MGNFLKIRKSRKISHVKDKHFRVCKFSYCIPLSTHLLADDFAVSTRVLLLEVIHAPHCMVVGVNPYYDLIFCHQGGPAHHQICKEETGEVILESTGDTYNELATFK